MSRKQQAHGHPQACLTSRGLCLKEAKLTLECRWDSDDLPEISDDEWDDDA